MRQDAHGGHGPEISAAAARTNDASLVPPDESPAHTSERAARGERIAEVRRAADLLRLDPSEPTRARLQEHLQMLFSAVRARSPEVAQRIADVQSVMEAGGGPVMNEVHAVDQLLADVASLEEAITPRLETTPDSLPISVCVVGESWIETLLHPDASEGVRMAFASCRFDDPKRVLESVAAFAPELFVIDIDLPGALALVSMLVDDPRTELVPIVALGDVGSSQRSAQYTAMGVLHTFPKSVPAASFRAACVEAVEQRRGRTIRMAVPAEMTFRPPEVADAHLTPLAGRRAIVADDDPVVVWFFADHLRRAGCLVEEALSAEGCLARALDPTAAPPDIVFCDAVMRGTNGDDLARILRADVATRDVVVVLASWKDEVLEASRAKGAATTYLNKGLTPEALLAKAVELLAPRDRAAARIRTEVVTGRIETIGIPRLVAMAAARERAAKITLRDGVFIHELFVRDGRLLSATRTAPDQHVEKGPRAAATAVGVREGLYTVEDADADALPLVGSPELLQDAIVAARAMTKAVSAERLPNLGSVTLDRDIAHIAAAASDRTRALIELLTTAAPRALLVQREASADELAFVLADLAVRGFVTSVREERAETHTVPLLLTNLRPRSTTPAPPAVAALVAGHEQTSISRPIAVEAWPIVERLATAESERSDANAESDRAERERTANVELSPPPFPSALETLSLPTTFDLPQDFAARSPQRDDISLPMPGTSRTRESDAPATSVSMRPAASVPRTRRVRTTLVLALAALLGGTAIRWSVSPPTQHRAAAAEPPRAPAPVPATGLLEITAAEGTPILVDGTERGLGPKLSIALPAGSHEVKTGGGEDKPRILEIARGKITHVDLSPKVPNGH